MKLFSALGDCTLRRMRPACSGSLVAQECLIQVQKSRPSAHKELGPHRGNGAILWAAAEAPSLGQSLPSMASDSHGSLSGHGVPAEDSG